MLRRPHVPVAHLFLQVREAVGQGQLLVRVARPLQPARLALEGAEPVQLAALVQPQVAELGALGGAAVRFNALGLGGGGRLLAGLLLGRLLGHARLLLDAPALHLLLAVAEVGAADGAVPYGAADVAELGLAAARHVGAALRQLHQAAALVAAAPARLLAHLEHGVQLPVVRAVLAQAVGRCACT